MTENQPLGSPRGQVEERIPEQAGQRQIRIGVFVIAGLIATVYLIFLLTDPSTFRGRYKVTTTVESVLGLRSRDPVQMRGVTVGQVTGFELSREGGDVVVTLEIEGEWPIPEGSFAQLVQPGIMAPRTVEIVPGNGPGTIGEGDSLPGTAVKGLLDDTESLGQMGQDVLNRVNELLSPENLDNISGSADGLNSLLADLSELVSNVGAEKENLSEMVASLTRAAEGVEGIAADGGEIGEDLASTIAKADSLMDRLDTTRMLMGGDQALNGDAFIEVDPASTLSAIVVDSGSSVVTDLESMRGVPLRWREADGF